MKKIIFILAISNSVSGFSQKPKPISPCCGIIDTKPANGIVLIRNNSTGQTMQMKTTGAEIKNFKIGDAVNADFNAKKIFSVNGISKTYTVTNPDPIDPCCIITNISGDPIDPCCAEISIKNNSTGETFSFNINESYLGTNQMNLSVLHQLKIGGPVAFDPVDSYTDKIGGNGFDPVDGNKDKVGNKRFDPVDGNKDKIGSNGFDPVDSYTDLRGYALLNVMINGESVFYSYPVTGTKPSVRKANSPGKKWVTQLNTNLKGMTGRLIIKMPVSSKALIKIYKTNETEQSDTWHESNFMNKALTGEENLLPGYYDISFWNKRINSILIKAGSDTRIQCGVLDINLKGTWKILDENKKEIFNRSLHEKVLLPVGKYFVATGKAAQPVTVKDGEITAFK